MSVVAILSVLGGSCLLGHIDQEDARIVVVCVRVDGA